MSAQDQIQKRFAQGYDGLSLRLKEAADFVADHPVDVATRSLRAVSASSGLAPATFTRMARALGFEGYEELRELTRASIGRQVGDFSERAARLRAEGPDEAGFLARQSAACIGNIDSLASQIEPALLEAAVDRLHRSRRVLVLGALGSTGIAEHLCYMASYFTENWQIAGRMGASLGSAMTGLGPQDALITITKPPFADRAIRATALAAEQGAHITVITESHTCPALRHADATFIVPSDSPHFFSSYAATLVLCETLMGMLAARSDSIAQARMEQVEKSNHRLHEFWAGT